MREKIFVYSLALVAGVALAGIGTAAPVQAGDVQVRVHFGYPHGHHHYGHRHGHKKWRYFKRHPRRHFGHLHPWPHRYRHYGHAHKPPYRPRHWGEHRGRNGFGIAAAARGRDRDDGPTRRWR